MNLHSCTQSPSTLSFLFYSYSIEVKWENGAGARGRQMHPNLSAAVIELRLLAILAKGLQPGFLDLLCNGMDGVVTIVGELHQKRTLDRGQPCCQKIGGNRSDFASRWNGKKKLSVFSK